MEMESYKTVTDKRVFQLEAKAKEIEGKVGIYPQALKNVRQVKLPDW